MPVIAPRSTTGNGISRSNPPSSPAPPSMGVSGSVVDVPVGSVVAVESATLDGVVGVTTLPPIGEKDPRSGEGVNCVAGGDAGRRTEVGVVVAAGGAVDVNVESPGAVNVTLSNTPPDEVTTMSRKPLSVAKPSGISKVTVVPSTVPGTATLASNLGASAKAPFCAGVQSDVAGWASSVVPAATSPAVASLRVTTPGALPSMRTADIAKDPVGPWDT